MFKQDVLTHKSRSHELLSMTDDAKSAFYELVDPSIAANLSRDELLPRVKDALNVISGRKMLPYNRQELAVLGLQLVDEMVGIGPIQPLLEDPDVSDILVNGPETIYVERRGKLEKTDIRFRDAKHVLNVAQRIVNAIGRRVDESNPMVDARLKDGSRVNVIAPPLALHGTCISIRKFPASKLMLSSLVDNDSLSEQMAEFLALATYCRCNILISGGTGSGKTTLLNALSRHISEDERILTIEDAAELEAVVGVVEPALDVDDLRDQPCTGRRDLALVQGKLIGIYLDLVLPTAVLRKRVVRLDTPAAHAFRIVDDVPVAPIGFSHPGLVAALVSGVDVVGTGVVACVAAKREAGEVDEILARQGRRHPTRRGDQGDEQGKA